MKTIDINSIPRSSIDRSFYKKQENLYRKIHNNKIRIGVIGTFLVLLTIGSCIYLFYQEKHEAEVQKDMFQATYHFEGKDFQKALEGDGTNKGFLFIAESFPYTKSANLACFYIGVAYIHQKEYDRAILFLKKFQANDLLLAARAWCLLGDAYSAKKEYAQAASHYMKAARYKPNSIYTPGYLMKAAIAFEAYKHYKDAYRCYQTILEQYPKCSHHDMATKEAGRLSSLL